ncbi:MAG: type II toxin-antitoxin system YafQ family toxin [Bacteroidales bacterium]|nr:type II toxin-antitoxin system YafQ family toxin [Bacteroidales bacterium]
MKFKIEFSKAYKKSYKRAEKRGLDMNKLDDVV